MWCHIGGFILRIPPEPAKGGRIRTHIKSLTYLYVDPGSQPLVQAYSPIKFATQRQTRITGVGFPYQAHSQGKRKQSDFYLGGYPRSKFIIFYLRMSGPAEPDPVPSR